jgi:hypothetical protein
MLVSFSWSSRVLRTRTMGSLLDIVGLGRLEELEVFDYYDGPVLFSCRDLAGGLHLAVLTAEDEDGQEWLYAPMSQERYQHIRSGAINLHDAFAKSETGSVFRVAVPYADDEPSQASLVSGLALPESLLPRATAVLEIPTQTMPDLSPSLVAKAVQRGREVMEIGLIFQGRLRTEAPTGLLGDVLTSFQDVFDTLGAHLSGQLPERGAIPASSRAWTQTALLVTGPGSFRLEIASATMQDLWADSRVRDVAEEFLSLLADSAEPSRLSDHLKRLPTRVISVYSRFLEALQKDIDKTTFSWASPAPGRGGSVEIASFSVKAAAQTIAKIELVEHVDMHVEGTLVGADYTDRRFHIDTYDRRLRGDVHPDALEDIDGATIGREYRAHIVETTHRRVISGDTRVTYQLRKIEPLADRLAPSD